MEYERVCPVKFWYYNSLITNQQNTLIIDKQWEQCIICQCSNAEPVICMRDVGKDNFVRSIEIKRDEVYSLILQENVSFLLCGLEGESFKGLPNDAIIRNMNVSVWLNSGTTIA
jgi:hypothetical protein